MAREARRRLWRPPAMALLVQSVAMAGFWIIRLYFSDDTYRAVQAILLAVGLIALGSMIALGWKALRRSGLV